MGLTRMAEEEAIDKKNRGLASKTSIPSSDKSEYDNAKGLKAKNLNLLMGKFNKFLKKGKNYGNKTFLPKKNLKKGEPFFSN